MTALAGQAGALRPEWKCAPRVSRGIGITPREMREDRILHEALADARAGTDGVRYP